MAGKLRTAAVITTLAFALTAGATATGGETRRGVFDLDILKERPGVPTGLRFHIVYKDPADPEGKPPPVAGAVFTLPRGLRIDDSAVPRCTATNEQFRAMGRGACPAASRVGTGQLTAMTGFPGADPVAADVVAYNGRGELIEVVFAEGTNVVAGMDRLTIEGRRLVAHPPATPGGPPDGRTAVREIRLNIPRRVGPGGKAYVTTPPACRTGVWRARADYEFADGGKTTITSRNRCIASRPRLQVTARPQRPTAGRRVTLRVVARSSKARCVRGARVRVAGRRARTDATGRAQIPIRFAAPGLRRVVVSKAGCRSGAARLRVLAG